MRKRIEAFESSFAHIYLSSGFSKNAKKTHACLRSGYWCWKNALENPIQAIKYLLRKI